MSVRMFVVQLSVAALYHSGVFVKPVQVRVDSLPEIPGSFHREAEVIDAHLFAFAVVGAETDDIALVGDHVD